MFSGGKRERKTKEEVLKERMCVVEGCEHTRVRRGYCLRHMVNPSAKPRKVHREKSMSHVQLDTESGLFIPTSRTKSAPERVSPSVCVFGNLWSIARKEVKVRDGWEGLLSSIDVRAVSCGSIHALALTHGGEVYSWGVGSYGRLGLGNDNDAKNAHAIKAFPEKIDRVAAGGAHNLAVGKSGKLYAWGANFHGQLGIDFSSSLPDPSKSPWDPSGRRKSVLPKPRERRVSSHIGIELSPMIHEAGRAPMTVPVFGSSEPTTIVEQVNKPTAVQRPQPLSDSGFGSAIVYIDCGQEHSGLVTENGALFMWGRGDYGQHGCGDLKDRIMPTEIDLSEFGTKVITKRIALGFCHTLALIECDGVPKLFSWGRGSHGQLGTGEEEDESHPCEVRADSPEWKAVLADPDDEFVAVAAGCSHSAVLSKSGKVFCWGGAKQVGDSQMFNVKSPQLVKGLPHDVPAIHVACGADHTVVVLDDGRLFSWGSNEQWQCGHLSTIDYPIPRVVEDLSRSFVEDADCGEDFTLIMGRERRSGTTYE